MIIGLTGLKGSGKDTVGAYLVKEHGFERKAFADPLKRSVAALLDIPFVDVDKFKNDPNYRVIIGSSRPINSEHPDSWHTDRDINFREFLQRYGTEAHRDVFGDNFWVDQTLPVQGFYPGRAIVVTDVRFANEAERVRQLEGKIWAVERDGIPTGDTHASEIIDFPVDRVVKNIGSYEDLYVEIEKALILA